MGRRRSRIVVAASAIGVGLLLFVLRGGFASAPRGQVLDVAVSGDAVAVSMTCRTGHGVFDEVEIHRLLTDGSSRLEGVLRRDGPVELDERFPPEDSPVRPERRYDFFARGLALEVDTLAAIGSVLSSNRSPCSVRIFERESDRWQLAAVFRPLEDGFVLASVILRGDRLAVGAITGSRATEGYAGAVVTYRREGRSWTEEGRWIQLASADLGYFGASLAWTAHGLAVGSPPRETGDRGTVVLLDETHGEWQVQQVLVPDPDPAGFGWSVAADGDRLAVGAAGSGAGGVVLFMYDDWRYEECGRWLARGPRLGAGAALAFVPGRIVVGSRMPDCQHHRYGATCWCMYGDTLWMDPGGFLPTFGPAPSPSTKALPPSLVDAAHGALSPFWLDVD